MARHQLCDYHNMVAILEKSEHNVDFHLMVDFIEASPLRIETTEEGTKILATVDGIHRTVTESSLRRNLKLQDEDGISFLPDTELFENLTLMGYNISPNQKFTFQKAPRVTSPAADEGTQEVKINSLKERVKLLEAREGVAAERSRDDAPIKGRSLDKGEAAAERTSDDTEEMETVLTSMDAATVLASEAPKVPTGSGSIPTAGPPAAEVPTGSDVVPTAGPVFATTTMVTPYRRRKGKEVMVESDTPKKQKVQEQIDSQVTRELEEQLERIKEELPIERRIELISDTVKYQDNYAKIHKFQSQQRKPWTKKQNRDYYMAVIRSNIGWKVKDFRGMAFEEVEAKFNSVWKRMEDLIPMGSKEEAERIKMKGLSLEQESEKKQKTSEEVTEEAKSFDEVPEEKVKEMMQLVPIEEVYVEALQVKHPIIDWKVHTEGQRSYWKITRLGGSSANYQFFIDLPKHLDREDLNQL
nr:hypothetical protein [Tanacetum cinerariifolium]